MSTWDAHLVPDWLVAACPNLERLHIDTWYADLASTTSGAPTTPVTPLLPHLTSLSILGVGHSQLFSAADVTAGVAVVAGQLTRLTFEYEPGAGNLEVQMRMVYEAWSDEPYYSDEDELRMQSGIAEDIAYVEKEIMEEGDLLSNLSALTAAGAPLLSALRPASYALRRSVWS